jgi:hypothetical protein
MSLDELRSLIAFKVENEHGMIEFICPLGRTGIDLTQVDLGRDILIQQRGIAVYENMPATEKKPK